MRASKPFIVEGKKRKALPPPPQLWDNQSLRQKSLASTKVLLSLAYYFNVYSM